MPSDPLPPRPPSDPAPRRVKPAHMAAIAAVSVAAVGLMGLNFVTLPSPAAVAPGEGLKIEVVAPVEPEIVEGSVMDVGELVDGFRYTPPRAAPRAPVYEAAWMEDEDAPAYAPSYGNAEVRRYASSPDAPRREPEPPRRERWFGFDNPLPDFRAERRAREARLEALEAQRRAEFEQRARRRWSSEPRYEPPREEARRYEAQRYEAPRYDDRRDDRRYRDERRYDGPPRGERPYEPSDGPYGPEVG